MPKVTFNKLVIRLSGRVGDLIFYRANGQKLSRSMPPNRTDKQKANSGTVSWPPRNTRHGAGQSPA